MQLNEDTVIQSLSTQVLKFTGTEVVIKTADHYRDAGDTLKQVKSALKQIEDKRLEYTGPLNKALKAINDDARTAAAPWTAAENGIKRAMIGYQAEQDRIQREEQRKRDEEARKEREKIEAQAIRAAASGKAEKAELLQERAAMVVAPVVMREMPKVTGVSMREVWYAECTDLAALVKAIADGKAPLSLVTANDKVLGAQARSLKADFVAPGVRVWSEKSMASGAA